MALYLRWCHSIGKFNHYNSVNLPEHQISGHGIPRVSYTQITWLQSLDAPHSERMPLLVSRQDLFHCASFHAQSTRCFLQCCDLLAVPTSPTGSNILHNCHKRSANGANEFPAMLLLNSLEGYFQHWPKFHIHISSLFKVKTSCEKRNTTNS